MKHITDWDAIWSETKENAQWVIIILLFIWVIASNGCTPKTVEPNQYDINGTWTGSGDFTISYLPTPAQMDIELIFSNSKFIEFFGLFKNTHIIGNIM